jgi:hypothetical protein
VRARFYNVKFVLNFLAGDQLYNLLLSFTLGAFRRARDFTKRTFLLHDLRVSVGEVLLFLKFELSNLFLNNFGLFDLFLFNFNF